MATKGAPRGKRQLPQGTTCVNRSISFFPRHLKLLDQESMHLPGGRSEFIRRSIDEFQRGYVRMITSPARGVIS